MIGVDNTHPLEAMVVRERTALIKHLSLAGTQRGHKKERSGGFRAHCARGVCATVYTLGCYSRVLKQDLLLNRSSMC